MKYARCQALKIKCVNLEFFFKKKTLKAFAPLAPHEYRVFSTLFSGSNLSSVPLLAAWEGKIDNECSHFPFVFQLYLLAHACNWLSVLYTQSKVVIRESY